MSDDGAANADDGDNGRNLPEVVRELAKILKSADENGPPSEAILTAIRRTLEITTGAYPPPSMMEQYKRVDPAINRHILDEAKTQADHRRGLEVFSTERSEDRQDTAQWYQQIVAVASLITALAIVGSSLYLAHSVSWPVAIAAALVGAVGVGGRPAATILTAIIGNRISTK